MSEKENEAAENVNEKGSLDIVQEPPSPKPSLISRYEVFILSRAIYFVPLLLLIGLCNGAAYGFNLSLTGVALPSIILDSSDILLNKTDSVVLQSLYPSSYLAGNIVGPIATPLIVFFCGYKATLIVFSLVGIFGQLLSTFSAHYAMLCIGRLICGISVGILTPAGIDYTISLAPPKIKGVVGVMYLVGVTLFIFLGNITVFFANVTYNWRIMTFIGILPLFIFFVSSLFIPESPVWRQEKRDKVSLNIGVKLKKFCTLRNQWRMFLSIIMIISFQFGGLYSMVIFLPITLDRAGIVDFYPRAGASVGVAAWNMITAIAVVFFIDLVRRKTLLAIGYVIMFVSNFTMAFVVFYVASPLNGYISIGFVLLFLIGNNGGVNSIIYFTFNELFEKDIALISSSLLFTILNAVALIVGSIYLPMQNAIELSGMLWFYSGIVLVTGIFLIIFLPETNGRVKKKTIPDPIPEAILLGNVELPQEDPILEREAIIEPQVSTDSNPSESNKEITS